VTELRRRDAEVMRFDAADFPARVSVSGLLGESWDVRLDMDGRTVMLTDITGAYYRRPTNFGCQLADDAETQWAQAEARAGAGGLLLTSGSWLNHPHRSGYANYRPVQLEAARKAGLTVPATLITSDPAQARAFAESHGDLVYKPMTHTPPGRGQVVYATPVTRRDLEGPAGQSISGTMHLLQQRIRAAFAVRLTVVDGHMFPAAIHAHSEAAAADWRADYDAVSYEAIAVPSGVAQSVRKLMDSLELRFGALDLLVTEDGRWHFLEVNPNGQWAWIEQEVGLPISATIAEALMRPAAAA